MKRKFVVKGMLLALGVGCSLSSWAQLNSATMYDGGNNNPGLRGSYYGANCDVTGSRSFGGGYDTDVSGSYSVGLGYITKVTGTHSFGFGYRTDVTAPYAVGIGANADASAIYSLSLGSNNVASANNAVAFGSYTRSTATGAMTIGYGANGGNPLINNVSKSLMIGFNSNLPTVTVGASAGVGTVGNVGIGGAPSSIKRLTVSKLNGGDWEYGLSVVVDRDKTRALAVNDHATGADLFVVWGNGSTNIKKLYTEEVEVRVDAMGAYWPDYVFKKDYRLRPLSEVKDFISKNSHLPDVPSESEVMEEGLNLGEMDAVLLRKVEELTLYIIQQQEEIEALKKLVEDSQK